MASKAKPRRSRKVTLLGKALGLGYEETEDLILYAEKQAGKGSITALSAKQAAPLLKYFKKQAKKNQARAYSPAALRQKLAGFFRVKPSRGTAKTRGRGGRLGGLLPAGALAFTAGLKLGELPARLFRRK